MKKFTSTILITFLILSICGLISCKNEPADNKTTNSSETQVSENIDETDYSQKLSNTWTSSKGTYFIEENLFLDPNGNWYGLDVPDENGNMVSSRYSLNGYLIHFLGSDSNNRIILCNKPDCKHDTSECNAYISGELSTSITNYIFGIENHIFYIDTNGNIVKMNEDGTEHENVLTIDKKYRLISCFLYGENVYIDATYPDTSSDGMDIEYPIMTALLEIDINNKTVKEIYNTDFVDGTELLGIYGDSAYYYYEATSSLLSSQTQEAFDEEQNSHDTRIFSVSLSTGQSTDIFSCKSYDMEPVKLYKDSIYYHSRKRAALIKYDIDSKTEEILINNLEGYIKLNDDFIFDNYLIYTKDNYNTDVYAEPKKENEYYFLDLNTKTATKIEYTVTDMYGNINGFYICADEKNDFVIPIEAISAGGDAKYGRISKKDFWNNNFDNIESLNWD